jgi:hypothetical protein
VRAKAKSSLHHLREKSGEIEERRERDVEGVRELNVTCGIEREKKKSCVIESNYAAATAGGLERRKKKNLIVYFNGLLLLVGWKKKF